MIVTRANLAGKVTILGDQVLKSMSNNLRPTRAEMTDVANSVFDGVDCISLGKEIANGLFPDQGIRTAHVIIQNAEQATNYSSMHSFIQHTSLKPFRTLEAVTAAIAKSCIDGDVGLCVVVSSNGNAANFVSKFRPPTPQVIVTTNKRLVSQSMVVFGQLALLVPHYDHDLDELVFQAIKWAKSKQWMANGANVVVLHGSVNASADEGSSFRIFSIDDLYKKMEL